MLWRKGEFLSRLAEPEDVFLPVPPRVICSNSGESRPLLDAIQELVSSVEHAVVRINGRGTTTALRFVMDQAQDGRLAVIDPEYSSGDIRACRFLLVGEPVRTVDYVLALAAWDLDDLIQYLLLNHPGQARSVMARLTASQELGFARGSPAVWQHVLDCMADHAMLATPRAACLKWLEQQLADYADRDLSSVGDHFLSYGIAVALKRLKKEHVLPGKALRVLSEWDVQSLIIATRVAERLNLGDQSVLRPWFSGPLLAEISTRMKNAHAAIGCLKQCVVEKRHGGQAASLLLKADPNWRPPSGQQLDLTGGDLRGAQWARCTLIRADLSLADLSGADLKKADLTGVKLTGTKFVRANLRAASLYASRASQADFRQADLSQARGAKGEFSAGIFTKANMSCGDFAKSNFSRADFNGANLTEARLDACEFERAQFADTDLSRAVLKRSLLPAIDFRSATVTATDFYGANLRSANFEDMQLSDCNFQAANLSRSLLTGSTAKGADFSYANLSQAGMAEIVWEDCDLQNADLSKIAFHMGSTRCGLVDSPYPSHGTRTGFYTDDYEDLVYKQPELIRKAALLRCDLRGAKLLDTDFYLVDLRGSIYDPACRRHFQKCGAILE